MKRELFVFIKRWIIEYGTDLKDLLLPIVDTTGETNDSRYGSKFFEELNAHFSNGLYASTNFYEHLPFLVCNVHDIGYSNPCFHQYMIEFNFSFTTISMCQEKYLENTPEDIYAVIDDFECYVLGMMRDIRDDMRKLDEFRPTANKITTIDQQALEIVDTADEIITVNKQFIFTIGECYNGSI